MVLWGRIWEESEPFSAVAPVESESFLSSRPEVIRVEDQRDKSSRFSLVSVSEIVRVSVR